MIKAMENLREAYAHYNRATGEGANELIKAYCTYKRKSAEVDRALERVKKIYEK